MFIYKAIRKRVENKRDRVQDANQTNSSSLSSKPCVRPSPGRQLALLLGKSAKIRSRTRKTVFFQLFFPVLLVFLFNLSSISNNVRRNSDAKTTFDPINSQATYPWQYYLENVGRWYPIAQTQQYDSADKSWIPFQWPLDVGPRIWFCPNDSSSFNASKIMTSILPQISKIGAGEIRGFANEQEMDSLYSRTTASMFASIVFTSGYPNYAFKLRLNGSFLPSTDGIDQTVIIDSSKGASPKDYGKYFDSGFFTMQSYLTSAIAQQSGIDNNSPFGDVEYTVRMPDRDFQGITPSWIQMWLVGFVTNIAIMFWFNTMVRQMAHEREHDIYRGFLLMGVRWWVYWSHWIITFALFSILLGWAIIGVMFWSKVVAISNVFLVYFWILLYLLQLMSVSICAVRLVASADTSNGIGLLCTFFFSAIWLPISANYQDVPQAIQLILSILPWFAAMYGGDLLYLYDYQGYSWGITFANTGSSGFSDLLGVQAASILFWLAIAAKIWGPRWRRRSQQVVDNGGDIVVDIKNPNDHEDFDTSQKVTALGVSGLRKVFPATREKREEMVAVDNIDMTLYQGEIFGLLGPNGAGKTTTVSMLSEEIEPSAGRAEYFVGGSKVLRLSENSDEIRSIIGVCPQHDILFDELTGEEHLELFSQLKGISDPIQIRSEVETRLEQCGLVDDAKVYTSKYSGGMKRKVSLAMSLLGNPKVLFLDEPTAGMDPYSRRQVWDMILSAKVGKTVILTTHFMDEADLLSDRIGIIRSGRIVASGSSLFLKHRFGVGYTLTCIINDATVGNKEHVNQLDKIVRDTIPSAVSNGGLEGREVSWSLPLEQEHHFCTLLSALDSKKQLVENIGLGLSTLEEVFLRTAYFDEVQEDHEERVEHIEDAPPLTDCIIKQPSTGKTFQALKRIILKQTHRIPQQIVFNIIFPLALVVIGFVLGNSYDETSSESPFPLPLTPNILTPDQGFDTLVNVAGFTNATTLSRPLQNVAYPTSDPTTNYWAGALLPNKTLSYNSSIVPSVPVLLEAVANQTLASFGGSINVVNAPMPYNKAFVVDVSMLLLPMLVGMAFFPLAYNVISLSLWKINKITLQLRLMGISTRALYAHATCAKLLLNVLPVTIVSIILALCLDSDVMGNGGRWLAYLLLIFSYCMCVIPFTLMFIPILNTERKAADVYPLIYNVLSIVPYIIIFLLTTQESQSTRDTGNTLGNVLTFIPSIGFQRGLQQLIGLKYLNSNGGVSWSDTFSFDNDVLIAILVMFCSSLVYFAVVWYQTRDAESSSSGQESSEESDGFILFKIVKFIRRFVNELILKRKTIDRSISLSTAAEVDTDVLFTNNDVALETNRVAELVNSSVEKTGMIASRLVKKFGHNKVAVDNLSLHTEAGELFVLLGPNGAGKTTTMRMLTGDLAPNSGRVVLNGIDLSTSPQVRREMYGGGSVGYCPQFDALFREITVSEHLEFAAKVKGISNSKPICESLIKRIGLQAYKDCRSQHLSGGNKRKLSLAIAMLGNPQVLFLDEPSTGMDPHSRRQMWKLLKPTNGGSSSYRPAILLSTHVMEEAAALANRIGIMINGRLECIGSIPHLTSTYCSRITNEMSIGLPGQEDAVICVVQTILLEKIVGSKVLEQVGNHLKLEVPSSGNVICQLSNLFSLLESVKEELSINYYSLAQTNLEQIFMRFAAKQSDED